jgi:hypothetical protein
MKSFKINTGKTDDAEKLSGKVPPISDMEEGSEEEEASETPKEEKKEVADGVGDSGDDKGASGGINKEQLKGAIKEVNMEKDLEYSVNNRSKEELECLIKMAQAKIDNGDFKDGGAGKGAAIIGG